MQIYKRERKIWQVKNSKLLEMHSFFSLANLLGVGKSQNLEVKNSKLLEML